MKYNVIFEIKALQIAITKKMCGKIKTKGEKLLPSPIQAQILSYLLKNTKKEVYQRDLEEILGVSRATVSETLFIMEKNGIVERIVSQKDARVKQIKLTQKSKEMHRKMSGEMNTLNEELLDGISEDEIDQFSDILKRMINNLNN